MKEDKNIAVSIQNIQKLGDQLAENWTYSLSKQFELQTSSD
jgi:hypothetical protein